MNNKILSIPFASLLASLVSPLAVKALPALPSCNTVPISTEKIGDECIQTAPLEAHATPETAGFSFIFPTDSPGPQSLQVRHESVIDGYGFDETSQYGHTTGPTYSFVQGGGYYSFNNEFEKLNHELENLQVMASSESMGDTEAVNYANNALNDLHTLEKATSQANASADTIQASVSASAYCGRGFVVCVQPLGSGITGTFYITEEYIGDPNQFISKTQNKINDEIFNLGSIAHVTTTDLPTMQYAKVTTTELPTTTIHYGNEFQSNSVPEPSEVLGVVSVSFFGLTSQFMYKQRKHKNAKLSKV